jgi:subtilase family serine protease
VREGIAAPDRRSSFSHRPQEVLVLAPLRRIRRLVASGSAAAALLLGGSTAPAGALPAAAAHPLIAPITRLAAHRFAGPPTFAQCLAVHQRCYTPQMMQKAYDMGPLYARGATGRGKKILIVDSFGSPTIQHDLDVFSTTFHLPKTHVKIVQPSGRVPKFDPTNLDVVNWAVETTLDVELAHSMAPGATIVLAETPVSETQGSTGLPEIMHAEQWAMRHHLADVISQSFGAGEQTFESPKRDIEALRYAFKEAVRRHVTVLAASGDTGAANYDRNLSLTTTPAAAWPASDPLVTSVGGTEVRLNAAGRRIRSDEAWNESDIFKEPAAGGGGRSSVFGRPWYQNCVTDVVHDSRGYPDISLNAAVFEAPLVYTSIPGFFTGWASIGGTSASAPLLAGIVAVADQALGHDLGLLNPKLYRLRDRRGSGEVDVTVGNTDIPNVAGFPATHGYDLATGWGTVDGAKLVHALGGYRH